MIKHLSLKFENRVIGMSGSAKAKLANDLYQHFEPLCTFYIHYVPVERQLAHSRDNINQFIGHAHKGDGPACIDDLLQFLHSESEIDNINQSIFTLYGTEFKCRARDVGNAFYKTLADFASENWKTRVHAYVRSHPYTKQ